MIMCPECDGKGYIVTCCDDMCNGMDYCIHGDGEEPCLACGGEGSIDDGDDEDWDSEPEEMEDWP